MVKNKAAKIRGIDDFRGRTILIPSEFSIQAMLVHRVFSSAGLRPGPPDDDRADATWQAVSPALMPEMIMNDQDSEIAGFVVAEPFATRAVQQGSAVQFFTSHSLWENHPCCVFVMDTFFTQYYPEAVRELIDSFVQAGRMLEDSKNNGPDPYILHFLDTDIKTAERMLSNACICFDPSLLVPDIEIFKMIHEYMSISMGMSPAVNGLDCLVDKSIIAEAISEGSV
jgi:NitT/TauT family transport system substrate-binding protein